MAEHNQVFSVTDKGLVSYPAELQVVATDIGNRRVKTPLFDFDTGLVKHGPHRPPIMVDTLFYDGSYYSITERRLAVRTDKTEDDDVYILTLFAIAKELREAHKMNDSREIKDNIYLAVGLPPGHKEKYGDKLARYYRKKKTVQFIYKDISYDVKISTVSINVQCFSAVVQMLDKLSDVTRAFVIDIGGYTTDVVLLVNGIPDTEFTQSLDRRGTVNFCNKVAQELASKSDIELMPIYIENYLRGIDDDLPDEVKSVITRMAEEYATQIVRELSERGVDFKVSTPVFVGGGSEMFRKWLTTVNPKAIFHTDIRANAAGYEYLAILELSDGE